MVREAIEIELHPYNIKREVGFYLCISWKQLICSLNKPDARSPRLRRPHARSAV
jgi:hypothetical protein